MINVSERQSAPSFAGRAELSRRSRPAPLSALGSVTLAPRVRRALWLLLRGRTLETRVALEDLDRARQAVAQSAAAVNLFLVERFAGPRFDAHVLSCLHLAPVLDLTASQDLEGCLDAARGLCLEIDRVLTLYDWIDDKRRLFEGLSQPRAQAVTRLFRMRRSLAELIVHLDGGGALSPMDLQ